MNVIAGDPPPVTVASGQFEDIDAQAEQLAGYDQRYQQLSRGRFEGRFAAYTFGRRLSINIEQTNRVLSQGGSTPAGRQALCFTAAGSAPVTINGAAVSPDAAFYFGPQIAFEACMPERSTIWVVDLDADLIEPPQREPASSGVLIDRRRVAKARRRIAADIHDFMQNPAAAQHQVALDNFCNAVAAEVNTLIDHDGEERSDHRLLAAHRLRLFRRAKAYIHERLAHGIDIGHLCTTVGASRRALEYVFDATVGVSPFRYIRAVQLNQIRRDLLRSNSAHQPLADIAASWGIWHSSRFSREYKEAFGEPPSDTRARTLRQGV
jgi:AraC family transcriptional regulator, ethanolamine operon transcriptional activator